MTASASPSSGTTSLSSLLSIALRLKSSSGRIDMTNLPFFGGEQDPKLLQPPAGRGLDGSLGDVEGGGGLGDRGVEQVTANKHLPLPGASRLVELGYGRTKGSVWPGLPRLTSRT